MNKVSLSIVLVIVMISTAFAGKDKSTLKEKIENAKEVKVYFNVTEIVDRESDKEVKKAFPGEQTTVRTAIPNEFSTNDIKNNVISVLNTEMQVSAFKLGEVSALGKSNDKETQFLDLSKLPDGIVAIVQVEGTYTNFVDLNKGGEVTHSMEIKSALFFYEIIGGVAKKIKVNMGMGANLGTSNFPSTKSDRKQGLDYLEKTFPVLSLLEEYTRTMKEYTGDFAKRMLKKHDKVISKRK